MTLARAPSPLWGLLLSPLLMLGGCNKAKVIITPPPDGTGQPDVEAPPDAATEAVREAARQYSDALRRRDPALASEWVVAETFDYYEDLRIAALRATRAQLEAWDLMSLMLILQIRVTTSRGELEHADGRALFEWAVDKGLVGDGAAEVPLDEVWIDADGTRAQVRIDSQPVIWLRRVGEDHWRVDIPEMIRLLGPTLEDLARERISVEGKLSTALNLVALGGDQPVDPAILDGPLE